MKDGLRNALLYVTYLVVIYLMTSIVGNISTVRAEHSFYIIIFERTERIVGYLKVIIIIQKIRRFIFYINEYTSTQTYTFVGILARLSSGDK